MLLGNLTRKNDCLTLLCNLVLTSDDLIHLPSMFYYIWDAVSVGSTKAKPVTINLNLTEIRLACSFSADYRYILITIHHL